MKTNVLSKLTVLVIFASTLAVLAPASSVFAAVGWTEDVLVSQIKATAGGALYVWVDDINGNQYDPCENAGVGNTRNYAFANLSDGVDGMRSLLTAAMLSGKTVQLRVEASEDGDASCTFNQVEIHND